MLKLKLINNTSNRKMTNSFANMMVWKLSKEVKISKDNFCKYIQASCQLINT